MVVLLQQIYHPWNNIMPDIKNLLTEFNKVFTPYLEEFFELPQGAEKKVMEAGHYSLLNGGKRLRPFLVCRCAALFGVPLFPAVARVGAALEMLHTYSLIHDDLPAMDNDDLRRGHPTCHKQYDEATAILAGDGLLTESFRLIATAKLPADIRCKLVEKLSILAGWKEGMIAGQCLDLYAEDIPNDCDRISLINHIEEMKTGALIRFACEAGAIIGRATEEQFSALSTYARKIGTAFQIVDDILDVEGNKELMGKTLGKDEAQGKITFVSCYGLETAKQMAKTLIEEAKKSLQIFPFGTEILCSLADYIYDRNC